MQLIEERVQPGRRLGRHIHHDPRSRAYAFTASVPILTVLHAHTLPVLDQGSLGSCTGNAVVGALGTSPLYEALPLDRILLDETVALRIYSAATALDGFPGSYPPQDTGSDGLSAAKAAKTLGLISGYQHTFTLNDALTALQTYPVITGVNWYEGFDSPDKDGLVKVSGKIRGGHEFVVVGCNAAKKTVTAINSWGTGYGAAGSFTFSWADWERLLGEQGDVTVLLPISVPAPNPTPVPGADGWFADELNRWLASKPWFYSSVRVAAAKWLKAKNL